MHRTTNTSSGMMAKRIRQVHFKKRTPSHDTQTLTATECLERGEGVLLAEVVRPEALELWIWQASDNDIDKLPPSTAIQQATAKLTIRCRARIHSNAPS